MLAPCERLPQAHAQGSGRRQVRREPAPRRHRLVYPPTRPHPSHRPQPRFSAARPPLAPRAPAKAAPIKPINCAHVRTIGKTANSRTLSELLCSTTKDLHPSPFSSAQIDALQPHRTAAPHPQEISARSPSPSTLARVRRPTAATTPTRIKSHKKSDTQRHRRAPGPDTLAPLASGRRAPPPHRANAPGRASPRPPPPRGPLPPNDSAE